MKLSNIKWQRINFTKENVRDIRISLEKSTEEKFKEFEILRRKTWQQAKNIILD